MAALPRRHGGSVSKGQPGFAEIAGELAGFARRKGGGSWHRVPATVAHDPEKEIDRRIGRVFHLGLDRGESRQVPNAAGGGQGDPGVAIGGTGGHEKFAVDPERFVFPHRGETARFRRRGDDGE